MKSESPYSGAWQAITLECERRPDAVTNLLEDYDNERQYYLGGKRLSLAESLKVRDHSPAGFFHGYLGSGPSQLALAVCLKLYPRQVAETVYHFFKEEYIALIPKEKEKFSIVMEVPANPLAYWDLEPVLDWEHDAQGKEGSLSAQEIKENERQAAKNKQLQKKHDQAYQRAIELPGSIRYEFVGSERFVSFCFLRIVNDYQGKVLVIATDPGDKADSGTSITNAAEQVATQVCQEFNIPFSKLDWIERYVRVASIRQYKESNDWNFEETWDRVTFTVGGQAPPRGKLIRPDWRPVSKEEIAKIKKLISTKN